MPMHRLSRYLVESAVIGIAVAVVVVLFFPQLLQRDPQRTVVEVHHEHDNRREQAPLSYAMAVERASPAVVNIYTPRWPATRCSVAISGAIRARAASVIPN